jgi:putative NIF3 family GTP cyclohydrolase 1 type 2
MNSAHAFLEVHAAAQALAEHAPRLQFARHALARAEQALAVAPAGPAVTQAAFNVVCARQMLDEAEKRQADLVLVHTDALARRVAQGAAP